MPPIILLRTSERTAFTTCRQKWWWSYIEHLRPKTEGGGALWFGDLIHQALAAYYIPGRKRGPHPAGTFEQLYHKSVERALGDGLDIWSDDEWVSALELGLAMLHGYVERWKDRDQQYEVIASEIQFRYPVRRARGEPVLCYYVGTIDGVWKDLSKNKRPYLFVEHKTATAISLDGLALDEQAGSYWTYGPAALRRSGILAENLSDEIDCVLYNFLRKSAPDPNAVYNENGHKLNKPKKPALVEYCAGHNIQGWAGKTQDELIELLGREKAYMLCGEVSKVQQTALFQREPIYRSRHDRERVHQRVIAQFEEMQACLNGGFDRVYKIPGPWYNPHCRGCPFRDMCELHETGNDWIAMKEATMEGWDPYEQHEIEHDERR